MAFVFPLPEGIMCRLFGRLLKVFNERSSKARENHATCGMIAAKYSQTSYTRSSEVRMAMTIGSIVPTWTTDKPK
jgi:hypothetical protein